MEFVALLVAHVRPVEAFRTQVKWTKVLEYPHLYVEKPYSFGFGGGRV